MPSSEWWYSGSWPPAETVTFTPYGRLVSSTLIELVGIGDHPDLAYVDLSSPANAVDPGFRGPFVGSFPELEVQRLRDQLAVVGRVTERDL